MKRLLIIVGIVVGVIIVGILLLPLFINVDSFRPDVEKKISDALGRQVHIGKITASFFSGGAEADNISISDDPAFSKGPFLQASSFQIGLQLMPLIFSRQFKVTTLTIKNPDIVLLKNSAGKWNYSSLGNSPQSTNQNAKTPASSASSSSTSDVTVDKLEIQNGKIRVGQSAGHSAGKEHTFDKVNLVVRNISTTSAMPFTLSAAIAGGGSLELQGQAGPLNQQDSAKTPFDAKLTLKHADLAASGLLSGVGGIVDFDGTVKSDGHHLVSHGKAQGSSLKLVAGGSPARRAVTLDYHSDFNLDSETGTVGANVHTGNSTANASGNLNAHGQETIAHLKVEGKNMAVNDVEGLLPAFGVNLPSGASLQGGVINTTLDAEGPLDKLVITGPVAVSDTHLTGYNLTSKLGAIAAFTGIKASNDTLIKTFSSALRVAPEGIMANNILLDMPDIGSITGAGTVSSSQALNFKMLLKLVGGGGMLGQLTGAAGGIQNKGIPFTIEGTSSNPVFRPTAAGVAGLLGGLVGNSQSQQGQQQGLGGLLNNMLNKKKKQ